MYNRRWVFFAACLGMMVFGIVMLSLGTINTFITAKFQLNDLSIASLASLLPLGILAGSLIFGPLVDRYGYKQLLIICALLIVVALEVIAYTKAFFLIRFSFFLIGIGGGAINGSTNALVADISTEKKGANLSLLGVFYGIGALGMPALIGILSKFFAVENLIGGIGIFVFLITILFSTLKFPAPKQAQGFPIKESVGLLKNGLLILLGMVLFFESGIEGLTNNWTTSFLQRDLAVTPQRALLALSLMVLGLTVARLVLGWALKKMRAYIVLIVCLCLAMLGSLLLRFAGGYPLAVTGLILMGVGFAAGFPVILGYVGELFAQLSGTAFSIAFVIALIGNTFLNFILGLISANYGIQHYLTMIHISILIMLILLAILLPKISRKITI